MANITLSVPEDLKKIMKEFPEINWSGLVRMSIEEKIKQLTWKNAMLKKLKEEKEFEDWTIDMGRKVNKGIVERLKRKKIL